MARTNVAVRAGVDCCAFPNLANGEAGAWPEGITYSLKKLPCSISTPVLVARSKDYLWFPSLVRLDKNSIVAVMQNRGDEIISPDKATALFSRSRDGGLHWGKPLKGFYGECPLELADGSHLLLPYYLAHGDQCLVGGSQRMVKEKDEVKFFKDSVTVRGWPRPCGTGWQSSGIADFMFNGQTVKLKDGEFLATLYGRFKDARRYALVMAESVDGRNWNIRSVIADENCKLAGVEGPCESATCRLKDGRLMCVFRLDCNVPYGQCWSLDEGRTWTVPVAMEAPHSVQPSLAVVKDGMVALSGGRPGVHFWINADGRGMDWQPIDLMAHHNACHPKDRMAASSSYTEVVALDDTTLLMIYDCIGFALHVEETPPWTPIPTDSPEPNSVWVVRIAVGIDG